jgi:hypothetical protein
MAKVELILPIRRRKSIILGSFDQLCFYGILLNVPFASPIFFNISHPTIMKSRMPNRKLLRLFNPDPMRRTALDHLHCFLNCCCLSRRQQNMQMIRHQHKSMQLVKPSIPATYNLFDDDIRQDRVDKEWMFLPRIGRHKIDACLPNPPSDPSHIRTLRG